MPKINIPKADKSTRVALQKLSKKLRSDRIGMFANVTLTDLTTNSLIYPDGEKLLTSLGAAINGQLPIGSTGGTPILATLTGTANQINITNAAGSITLSTPQDIHTTASNFIVAGATVNGTLDVSSGKVLVEDNAITEPKDETDGYVGVAKISSSGRIYFAVEDKTYYINGTLVPGSGEAMGLLMGLTHS